MSMSMFNADLHWRSGDFDSGLDRISNYDVRAGFHSAAFAVWRGGVVALLLGSRGGTHKAVVGVVGLPCGSAVVDGRWIGVARYGALKAVRMVHMLSVGFSWVRSG